MRGNLYGSGGGKTSTADPNFKGAQTGGIIPTDNIASLAADASGAPSNITPSKIINESFAGVMLSRQLFANKSAGIRL